MKSSLILLCVWTMIGFQNAWASEAAEPSKLEVLNAQVKEAKAVSDELFRTSRVLFKAATSKILAENNEKLDLADVEAALRATLKAWEKMNGLSATLGSDLESFISKEESFEMAGTFPSIAAIIVGYAVMRLSKSYKTGAFIFALGVAGGIATVLIGEFKEGRELKAQWEDELKRRHRAVLMHLSNTVAIFELLSNQPESSLKKDFPWVEEAATQISKDLEELERAADSQKN